MSLGEFRGGEVSFAVLAPPTAIIAPSVGAAPPRSKPENVDVQSELHLLEP